MEGATSRTADDKVIFLQGVIAFTLLVIFAIVILVSMFRFNSNEVIAIAGIFASWITAIIAFFFAERGARTTVSNITRSADDRVRDITKSAEDRVHAKDKEADATLAEMGSLLNNTISGYVETIKKIQEDMEEQIKRSTAEKESISEPLGEIVE
jgi:Na+/phosphate symporter